MKITRANLLEYAIRKGLEPIHIDGVPEGFSWKEPDLQIGETFIKGKIINFKPLGDYE